MTVLRWLAGEDVELPRSVTSGRQAPVYRVNSVEQVRRQGVRTGLDLFTKDELEGLSKMLFSADPQLTHPWLVVTLGAIEVPPDLSERDAAKAIALSVNSSLESLFADEEKRIFAPKSLVSKAMATAVEDARKAGELMRARS